MQCNAILVATEGKNGEAELALSEATGSQVGTTPVASGWTDDGMALCFVVNGWLPQRSGVFLCDFSRSSWGTPESLWWPHTGASEGPVSGKRICDCLFFCVFRACVLSFVFEGSSLCGNFRPSNIAAQIRVLSLGRGPGKQSLQFLDAGSHVKTDVFLTDRNGCGGKREAEFAG